MNVYTLSPDEIAELADAFAWATEHGGRVRVAVDDGLKVDIGDGAGWSLPMGTDTTGRS